MLAPGGPGLVWFLWGRRGARMARQTEAVRSREDGSLNMGSPCPSSQCLALLPAIKALTHLSTGRQRRVTLLSFKASDEWTFSFHQIVSRFFRGTARGPNPKLCWHYLCFSLETCYIRCETRTSVSPPLCRGSPELWRREASSRPTVRCQAQK